MTARPAPIHAVPLLAAGDHKASASCRCGPVSASDLCEPGRLVYVHRHLDPRDHDTRPTPGRQEDPR